MGTEGVFENRETGDEVRPLGRQAAVAEMEGTYTAASEKRVPATLGQVRRNVGRGRFTTVFRVLAEVATGSFEGYQDEEAELAFEKALGIDHARTDRLADAADDDLEMARREVYVFFRIFEAPSSSIGAVLAGDASAPLPPSSAAGGTRPRSCRGPRSLPGR